MNASSASLPFFWESSANAAARPTTDKMHAVSKIRIGFSFGPLLKQPDTRDHDCLPDTHVCSSAETDEHAIGSEAQDHAAVAGDQLDLAARRVSILELHIAR